MKGQIEEIDTNAKTFMFCGSYQKKEEEALIKIFKEIRDRKIKLL